MNWLHGRIAWTLVFDLNQYGKDAVAKNPLGENSLLKMELVAENGNRTAEGKPGEAMISLNLKPGKSAAPEALSVEAKWLTPEGN